VPRSIRPGDLLAGRYRLVDLLAESGGGRFWRAHDRVLERHVALHVMDVDDPRAEPLMEAARQSATVPDRHLLRVLDADRIDGLCFVVNEWGAGDSLDIMLAADGPLDPRRAAWVVSEVAEAMAAGHRAGVAHGRLIPENVLIDHGGRVRIIGFAVDAALHGLPPGRPSADVTDLAGLLYAALTGKWPGDGASRVPPAPLLSGRVLRPRQVRAGIPRPLDALCDQVLDPYGAPGTAPTHHPHDLATAQGICDYLRDFVGDPAGLAAAEAAAGHRGAETVNLPALSDPPARAAGSDAPGGDSAPSAGSEPGPGTDPGLATQRGLPIFDDDGDDVSWLDAPGEPPPPPPPFEDPPERPLFAPEPSGGGAARTPRHPHSRSARPGSGAPEEYWPWADTGTGTGMGFVITEPEEEPVEVPGRTWLRLAAAVAVCVLLLVASVVAYNLGRGRTPLGAEPADTSAPPSPASSPPASAPPLEGLTATDFDPQGSPPEENPDLAGLAVDGDPSTAWRTQTYIQNLGPRGLKTGVGLIIDLGASRDLRLVDVRFDGEPTEFSLFVTDETPTAVDDLTAVGTGSGGRARVEVEATGRYLTLWLTSLPRVADGFRGDVAEVTVR